MRVLFVDDEPVNRKVVGVMLEASGIEMAEASDAPSGLRMIDAEHFDVVLMDLRMPGMDGLSAIGSIRRRPDERRTLPIVLVTADSTMDLPERASSAGADALVRKPVGMKDLFDAMATAISAREQTVLL